MCAARILRVTRTVQVGLLGRYPPLLSVTSGYTPCRSIYAGERRKVQLNDLTEPGDIIVRVRAFKRRVMAPKFVPGQWSDEV